MRVHHKTPTLVSMWMLDVFCCALGCVTLLWLLNTRQAGDQTAAAKSALTDLDRTRSDLVQSRADLKLALTNLDSTKLRLNSEVQQLTTQLGAVRTEKDDLARKLGVAQDEAKSAQAQLDATKTALNAAETKLDTRAKDLVAVRDKVDAAEDALRKKQKEADVLAKKVTDAAAAADDLAKLIRKKDEERLALEKRVSDMQKSLDDVDARLAAAKKELVAAAATAKTADTKAVADLTTAKAAASKADADLNAARGQIKDLQKKVSDANTTIIDLQGDKAKLADKVNQAAKDVENRFAGIVMSGRAVVFLVDMSGSMEKTDAQTAAPHKWPVVCETVAKVMRTLPTLERYQVVVFSRQARWLFGTGEWQPFEGEKSATGVKDALLKVKPEGDTNLHAAFDLAFGLRAKGLDTVYLFSDGLPTSGPGLTPAQETATPPLDETKRGEILSRYLREKLRTTWNRPGAGAADRVKVHAVGFFYESPDVGAFLWALARENSGSFVGMSKP
jgi:predicted  nucleic acid-binding Zn-ribbon protein